MNLIILETADDMDVGTTMRDLRTTSTWLQLHQLTIFGALHEDLRSSFFFTYVLISLCGSHFPQILAIISTADGQKKNILRERQCFENI